MNDSNAPQTCPGIFYLRTVCVIKFTHFETLVLVEKKKHFSCAPPMSISLQIHLGNNQTSWYCSESPCENFFHYQ